MDQFMMCNNKKYFKAGVIFSKIIGVSYLEFKMVKITA